MGFFVRSIMGLWLISMCFYSLNGIYLTKSDDKGIEAFWLIDQSSYTIFEVNKSKWFWFRFYAYALDIYSGNSVFYLLD